MTEFSLVEKELKDKKNMLAKTDRKIEIINGNK